MYKYQQKLKEYGLSEAEVSDGLRKKIKVFTDLENKFNKLNQELEDTDDEDEETIEKLNDQLDQIEDDMKGQDVVLVGEVTKFYNNKDKYAEMAKKLAEGRAKKAAAKTAAPAAAAPAATATAAAAPAAAPAAAASVATATAEKKESSGSGILLAGVLVILTGGLVWWNYSRK